MLIVNMRQIIKFIFYAILKPRLFSSFKRHTLSDEHLKFTHILEGINYLRVADMPKTYLEFGVIPAELSGSHKCFKLSKSSRYVILCI